MALTRAFIYRPLSILGAIVAIHTIVVGWGFIHVEAVKTTPLYRVLDNIGNPALMGWIMIAVGLAVIASYIKRRFVWATSQAQSFVWLFLFWAYIISQQIYIGIQNALFWVMLSGYIAFAFGNRDTWVDKTDDNVLR